MSLDQLPVRRPTPSPLILGGAGFIGTRMCMQLIAAGHPVTVFDDLSRPGTDWNLGWLQERFGRQVRVLRHDVRDADAVAAAVANATMVFHFAAQVAVTTSLAEPRTDFAVNAAGTLNVLEALRRRQAPPPLLYTSTNKVYGSIADVDLRPVGKRYEPVDAALRQRGLDEDRSLDLLTPYGCSKGAADQYVLDYARSFGLRTVVFRMSCIYGPNQNGTADQGWVAHLVRRHLEEQPIEIFGDGLQVRDLLFADDLTRAMLLAWRHIDRLSGRAFNIGGGPANACSLLELLDRLEQLHGHPAEVRVQPWRQGDQRWYVSDTSRFCAATGWQPRVGLHQGIVQLSRWLQQRRVPAPTAVRAAAAVPSRARP